MTNGHAVEAADCKGFWEHARKVIEKKTSTPERPSKRTGKIKNAGFTASELWYHQP